jgi:hypothetical protein
MIPWYSPMPTRPPPSTVVRSTSRASRTRTACGFLLAVLVLPSACRRERAVPAAVDLLAELPRSERRAALPVDDAIAVTHVGAGTDVQPALMTAAPARVTFSVALPPRPRLVTAVAMAPDAEGRFGAGARARIAIADRVHEQLFARDITPPASGALEWHPVEVDLSAYHGWQWSLFYRPTGKVWRLVLSADATPGGTLVWRRPVIAPVGR